MPIHTHTRTHPGHSPPHHPLYRRVYFNKTSDSADDYLVDHSIIMYLLDPAGTPRALRPTYTRLPA